MLDLTLPEKNVLFTTGTDNGVGKMLMVSGIEHVLHQQGFISRANWIH